MINYLSVLIGFLAGVFLTALFMEFRHHIHALEERLSLMERAKQKRLNYVSLEEIEHAMAALDVMDRELEFKRSVLDNAKAHLAKAHNPEKG